LCHCVRRRSQTRSPTAELSHQLRSQVRHFATAWQPPARKGLGDAGLDLKSSSLSSLLLLLLGGKRSRVIPIEDLPEEPRHLHLIRRHSRERRGTCTKFLLLGLSSSGHTLRTCSKSSFSSPQRRHVESAPWTFFWVSPSGRERPPLSWESKTSFFLEVPCRGLKGPSPYTRRVWVWLCGPSLT
jgi:hypothetical protein